MTAMPRVGSGSAGTDGRDTPNVTPPRFAFGSRHSSMVPHAYTSVFRDRHCLDTASHIAGYVMNEKT
jgi:hypothetical protein